MDTYFKVIDEPFHDSPVNHNILYQDVRSQLKKLKCEVKLSLLRMTREIGIDYMKRLLINSYPLTGIYDMLEELLTTTSDPNKANNNFFYQYQ